MLVEEILERIAKIKEIALIRGDDEVAHHMQDDLVRDVIQYISQDSSEAQLLARVVLKVYDIDFARWYA